MNFLGKQCKVLEDGNYLLDIKPVKDYEQIDIYVSKDEYVTIFDGGTTFASLAMVYNLNLQYFVDSVVKICDKYKLSIDDEIIYLECTEETFNSRLDDFISAINEICII